MKEGDALKTKPSPLKVTVLLPDWETGPLPPRKSSIAENAKGSVGLGVNQPASDPAMRAQGWPSAKFGDKEASR